MRAIPSAVAAVLYAVGDVGSGGASLVTSFAPMTSTPRSVRRNCRRTRCRRPVVTAASVTSGDDDVDNESGNVSRETSLDGAAASDPPANPYGDPNYPDLEFVNYDDPEYSADRGSDEEFDNNAAALDEIEIEAMRESRRRVNDEYQFETYHAKILRGNQPAEGPTVCSRGEWTVFSADTFLAPFEEVVAARSPTAKAAPRFTKREEVLKVVSTGRKKIVDKDADWRVDGERIVHEERLADDIDFPPRSATAEDEESGSYWEDDDRTFVERNAMCWPEEMSSLDFRGPAGCMCVGTAYTVCDAVKMYDTDSDTENNNDNNNEGPFREMRVELGVQDNNMRFRIKLDYALLNPDECKEGSTPPPLHLRTLTVCRETLDGRWPSPSDNGDDDGTLNGKEEETHPSPRDNANVAGALFGPAGAPGGLYDPPLVGSEERANAHYILLDLEGGATALIPHRLDQESEKNDDENADGGGGVGAGMGRGDGWVTSLDWTPGPIRYQVDRKVLGGTKLKGLRTLELSEVQGADADRWRPKDGGKNMNQ